MEGLELESSAKKNGKCLFKIVLFIFGFTGSSLLLGLFSSHKQGYFLVVVCRLRFAVASLVEHML